MSFPEGHEFAKKKAERHRELRPRRAAHADGHARWACGSSWARPVEEVADQPALSEEELLERLKAEFGAEEVFDDGGRDLTMPQPPNMNQMLKQVQQMQAEMAKAQEELKNERVEASAGGGTVKVV